MDWDSVKNVLLLEDRGVVSLVGAGGKTTLMFSLAKLVRDCGKKVVTTTTTKIFMPTEEQSFNVVLSDEPEVLLTDSQRILNLFGHVTVGAEYLEEQNKIKGVTPEVVARLWRSGIADWIIVEADGSAGRPLKAPDSHEPVIPAVTSHLVAVVGLRAIGLPFDSRHVFRLNRYAAVTNLNLGDTITVSSVADALLHPEGIMKGALLEMRKFVFLNKAEREDLQRVGDEVAETIKYRGRSAIDRIFIGSAAEEPDRWKWLDVQAGSAS